MAAARWRGRGEGRAPLGASLFLMWASCSSSLSSFFVLLSLFQVFFSSSFPSVFLPLFHFFLPLFHSVFFLPLVLLYWFFAVVFFFFLFGPELLSIFTVGFLFCFSLLWFSFFLFSFSFSCSSLFIFTVDFFFLVVMDVFVFVLLNVD